MSAMEATTAPAANGEPLRIVLNEVGGATWTGGITYRNNLLKSLQLCDQRTEILVIDRQKAISAGHHRVIVPIEPKTWFGRKFSAVLRRYRGMDYPLYKTLRTESAQVLFPSPYSAGSRIASLYWIPDFQFVHLPHLYSAEQLNHYRRKLPKYFANVPIIVVSSEDARRDLELFSPAHAAKARVVRFVAHVPENIYESDPAEVAKIYHLPAEFIYLPNQFWAHKNHRVVFEALALLKQRGIRPFVVCSGNPLDVRDPGFFAQVLQRISELGVRDQVALVGLLPHPHVYALLRQAKFVLNPSKFEGWSTSVEEAKSVGKRVLLSDLAVHREQNPPGGVYFKPDSAEDLADKLGRLWAEVPAGPDAALEAEARRRLAGRMRDFADHFLRACRDARAAVR